MSSLTSTAIRERLRELEAETRKLKSKSGKLRAMMRKQVGQTKDADGEKSKLKEAREARLRCMKAEVEEKETEMNALKSEVEKKEVEEEARKRRGIALVSVEGKVVWQECGTTAGWAKGESAGPVKLETMIEADGSEKIIGMERMEDAEERFGEITNWSPNKGYGLIEMEDAVIHGMHTVMFHVSDMPEDTEEDPRVLTREKVYMGMRVRFRVGPKTKAAKEWSAKSLCMAEEIEEDKWYGREPGRVYGMLIDTLEPDIGAVKIYTGEVLTYPKALFPEVRSEAVSLMVREGHGITSLREEVDMNWYTGVITEWHEKMGFGVINTEEGEGIFFHVKYLPAAAVASDARILSVDQVEAHLGATVAFKRRVRKNKKAWMAIQIRTMDQSALRAAAGHEWPMLHNDAWLRGDWVPPTALAGWSYNPTGVQVVMQPDNPYALQEWSESPRTYGLPECFQYNYAA